MCGIVGYVGSKDALSVILSGLEKLEYRGYDSAGVAVLEDGKLQVTRALGKLSELKKLFSQRDPEKRAPLGIGHTRWATHGKPSENNAHPHSAGRISVVHNGIIENYSELREELESEGCRFSSETDTEIAAHLLNRAVMRGVTPFEALKEICRTIRGSYAFVAIDSHYPDRILIAKSSSPVVIGIAEDEVIVASDIPAVLPYTRNVVILEDGDLAEVRVGSLVIEQLGATGDSTSVERPVQRISWDPVTAQKGGFKHFMLKEIHDQVNVLAESFRGRVELEEAKVNLPELTLSRDEIKQLSRIVLIACGTAWHACLVAKYYIEQYAKIPVEVDYASEFRYRAPVLDNRTLVIAVSQSGETADTLAAIEMAARTARTAAVCNVLGSSLARKVKSVLLTQAGPEISVASTKAFTTQVVVLHLLALYLAQERGVLPPTAIAPLIQGLVQLPSAIALAVKQEKEIERVARDYYQARDILCVGRGILFPIALEAALKIKELSYIHAEGYPAGEMKHGPIALIDETVPVIVLLQRSDVLFEKMVSNLREVESRGGRIVAITDVPDNKQLKQFAKHIIELPFVSESMSPIVHTIPLQIFAYHMAVLNGTDVDLPRNLAKSVTVE